MASGISARELAFRWFQDFDVLYPHAGEALVAVGLRGKMPLQSPGLACGEFPKRGWEPVKTCFWFSPACILMSLPRCFSIEALVDRHCRSRQGRAEARLIDLPLSAPYRDGIALVHYARSLYREDPVQIVAPGVPNGRRFLRCRHIEFAVELADMTLTVPVLTSYLTCSTSARMNRFCSQMDNCSHRLPATSSSHRLHTGHHFSAWVWRPMSS